MTIVWIAIICAVLIYVYNKSGFVEGPYKKQAISTVKSFIHLCYSCPKKMDKDFITTTEIALLDKIKNKKDFEKWAEDEAKKLGSIEIAIYNDIQSTLGVALAFSDSDEADIRKKTLRRMEAIAYQCLTRAFNNIGRVDTREQFGVRKPDTDD